MSKTIESSAEKTKSDEKRTAPEIFDELMQRYTNEFVKIADERGVKTSVLIIVDPEFPDTPFIHTRGETLEQAEIVAHTLRGYQQTIMDKITP